MCGIFAIADHRDAARVVANGLQGLQKRGEEGVGIVSSDLKALYSHHQLGLVSSIKPSEFEKLPGSKAVGHIRYGTSGERGVLKNIQPLMANLNLAVAHNGEITNYAALRQELQKKGAIFSTTSDTEVILHAIMQTNPDLPWEQRVMSVLPRLEGAYSLLILTPDDSIAVRDPLGIRPLVWGLHNDSVVFASEDAPFTYLGVSRHGDVPPGEVWVVRGKKIEKYETMHDSRPRHCSFEYVYFARPDSTMSGMSVWEVRTKLGRELAAEARGQLAESGVDVVLPVPDSGLHASEGFSLASGIPLIHGFVRAHYVGRSFTKPTQADRREAVMRKLSPIMPALRRKRVAIVDDSLVRGTTMQIIVNIVREAGAEWVGAYIPSPHVKHPCHYGIDTPRLQELAFNQHVNEAGIRESITADHLQFLSYEGYQKALMSVNGSGSGKAYPFCDACFTGHYPAGKPAQAVS